MRPQMQQQVFAAGRWDGNADVLLPLAVPTARGTCYVVRTPYHDAPASVS